MLPYRAFLSLRHAAYDRGWLKSTPVPALCIGNVTAGGTGKTPFVEMTLGMMPGAAVLSRGYGRRSKGYAEVDADGSARQYGDEPLQIKRGFPDRTVAVCEDRTEGCRRLYAGGAECVILDDAMQHRRIRPAATVCLVDFGRPVWKDRMLPFGRLRDLPSRMKAADAIVVTKCPEDISEAQKDECRSHLPAGVPVLFAGLEYPHIVPAFPEAEPRDIYDNVILLTGIASNAPLLRHLGESVVQTLEFPDHHPFSGRDVDRIARVADGHPDCIILTTAKDAVRLHGLEIPPEVRRRLYVQPVRCRFLTGKDADIYQKFLVSLRQNHLKHKTI